jgi:hypothetical protein
MLAWRGHRFGNPEWLAKASFFDQPLVATIMSNMTLWQGSKAEMVTAIAATVGIPFYLGIIHTPIPQLAFYGGFASAAMATGEFVEHSDLARGGWRVFLADSAVWFGVIALLGGAAYLFALIF